MKSLNPRGENPATAKLHRASESQAEERYRELVEELDAIVWEADPHTWQFIFVSARAEQILGYPIERWLTERDFWVNHIHPGDRQHTVAACRQAISERRDHRLEYRTATSDGRVIWLEDIVRVVCSDQGSVRRLHGVMIDITARKEAENKLTERTLYLNALIENSPLAIVALDPVHRVRMINPAFDRLFGYSAPEVVGHNLDDLIASEETHVEAVGYTKRVGAGETIHAIARRRRKDGAVVDVELHAVPLLIRGKLKGVYALYQDITERKQAEGVLEERTAVLQGLVQNNPLAIAELDSQDRVTMVNAAFERMFLYTAQEVIGRPLEELIKTPAMAAETADFIRRINRGETLHAFTQRRRKDGVSLDVEIYGVPLMIRGKWMGAVGIYQDLTERNRVEDALRQSLKMEAIGQLAGGVAHDFNNLLTGMLGSTDLLLERLGPSGSLRQLAEQIREGAERATSLTQQLLAFSRRQTLMPKVLDLNAVVAHMNQLLRRVIREDIELVTVLEPRLGHVKADPSQIEQVILNLAVNARDAMPDGGKLAIETSNVAVNETTARRRRPLQPGSYVLLAMTDSGGGMDAGTRSRIFEPFFTTKQRGKGTGLGLATVYGIVKQSNGYISVHSQPQRGTRFEIYLPRVEEPVDASLLESVPARPVWGSETILLVEDERSIRRPTCEFLQKNGYTVLEAEDGAAAIRVAQGHKGPIHLLLTDLVMPKMNGGELAQRIAEMRPEVKVLYMSGYAENKVVHHEVVNGRAHLLQKPFTLDALAHKAREVLGEHT